MNNKLYLLMSFAMCLCVSLVSLALMKPRPKAENIETFFNLVMTEKTLEDSCNQVLSMSNITDETVKQLAYKKFGEVAKQEFITFFDTTFTAQELEEITTFFASETGRKFVSNGESQSQMLQKAFQELMIFVQDHLRQQAKASTSATAIIDFNELCKDKNDEEKRALFNELVSHDDLTIVKFSSIMCQPCKGYAVTFEDVSNQLKTIDFKGKHVDIKYVAVDINIASAIAEEYHLKSVPATLFFNKGNNLDTKIGALSKEILLTRIRELAV